MSCEIHFSTAPWLYPTERDILSVLVEWPDSTATALAHAAQMPVARTRQTLRGLEAAGGVIRTKSATADQCASPDLWSPSLDGARWLMSTEADQIQSVSRAPAGGTPGPVDATALSRVIDVLARHPGLPVAEIARMAELPRWAVVQILTALRDQRFIIRIPRRGPSSARNADGWALDPTAPAPSAFPEESPDAQR